MAMALQEQGIEAVSLTGWQAGVETDGVFGAARIRHIDTERLRRWLDAWDYQQFEIGLPRDKGKEKESI